MQDSFFTSSMLEANPLLGKAMNGSDTLQNYSGSIQNVEELMKLSSERMIRQFTFSKSNEFSIDPSNEKLVMTKQETQSFTHLKFSVKKDSINPLDSQKKSSYHDFSFSPCTKLDYMSDIKSDTHDTTVDSIDLRGKKNFSNFAKKTTNFVESNFVQTKTISTKQKVEISEMVNPIDVSCGYDVSKNYKNDLNCSQMFSEVHPAFLDGSPFKFHD